MELTRKIKIVMQMQFRRWTKTNCIILAILSAFSCGKKSNAINQSSKKSKKIIDSIRNLKIEAHLKRSGENIPGITAFDEYTMIKIPQFVTLTKGQTLSNKSRIYFNVENDEYEFYCEYYGYNEMTADYIYNHSGVSFSDSLANKIYVFDDCYNQEHRSIGFPAGYDYPIDQGKKIILKILGADPMFDTSGFTEIEFTQI